MIGALLLGVPSEDDLRFIGNVGTGFTDAMLPDLFDRLARLKQPASPFKESVPREFSRNAYWVAPDLVGEVEYRSISRDGRLRHHRGADCNRTKLPSNLPVAR